MTREEMIERLIDDDIQVIKDGIENNDYYYLDFVLRNGMGYEKCSDEALKEEFFSRTWETE